MTRLTLETKYGKVVIESERDDLSLPDLMEELIVPLLLGSGYAEKTIREALAV